MVIYLIWLFATALNIKAVQRGTVFYALTVLKEGMPRGLKSQELQLVFLGQCAFIFVCVD